MQPAPSKHPHNVGLIDIIWWSVALIGLVLSQLRESIAQDQERAESLRIKMQDLEREIQDVESKIHFTEIKQKDLLKLQEQMTEKSATRSALFAEKESRHGSLQDEIEGLSICSIGF